MYHVQWMGYVKPYEDTLAKGTEAEDSHRTHLNTDRWQWFWYACSYPNFEQGFPLCVYISFYGLLCFCHKLLQDLSHTGQETDYLEPGDLGDIFCFIYSHGYIDSRPIPRFILSPSADQVASLSHSLNSR